MRVRHGLTVLLGAASLAAALPAAAHGARIVTWSDPAVAESRFVDPQAAPAGSYNEPPGVADRPNALRASVYLPDGYGDDPQRRYPVLYLLHGQGDAYDSWPNPAKGDLLRTAAGFPGVIVMPEGDRGFYTNWWNGGRRGSPAWERYHLDQLVPLVERRLRVRRGRRWHAIAGISMGGEGAMFYASQRPGYFGTAASFSGPLSIQRVTYQEAFEAGTRQDREAIFGDPDAQEFYWRGHNPKALVQNLRHTRLYVAAGNGVPNPLSPDELTNPGGQAVEAELGQQAAGFANAAESAGAPITYRPRQGIHDWPYWRADLADAIAWGLFRRPPRSAGHWRYETVARVGTAWGTRYRFARAPGEVVALIRAGRRLRGEGSGKVTLRRTGACPRTLELPFDIPLWQLRCEPAPGGGCPP